MGRDRDLTANTVESLAGKEEVTLCVTDDGLGGLSVLSEIEGRLGKPSPWRKARLLYFNAAVRPALALRPMEEQTAVFDRALEGMIGHRPDAILIACGSLSVIYPRTTFSRTTTLPVLNIVDAGVDLLAEALAEDPDSVAVIFATVVTIRVGTHRRRLIEGGIAPERIVVQACPELAWSIQTFGAESPEVERILLHCVREAWAQVLRRGSGPPPRIHVGLCCSHYGYSLPLWKRVMEETTGGGRGPGGADPEIVCLNPNLRMADSLLGRSGEARSEPCEVDLRVLSKVELTAEIGHVAPFLSPRVSAALNAYEHRADLFEDDSAPEAGRGSGPLSPTAWQ